VRNQFILPFRANIDFADGESLAELDQAHFGKKIPRAGFEKN